MFLDESTVEDTALMWFEELGINSLDQRDVAVDRGALG